MDETRQSVYRGVHWHRKGSKWQARVAWTEGGQKHSLCAGLHSELEAARAYSAKVLKVLGEAGWGRLNVLPGDAAIADSVATAAAAAAVPPQMPAGGQQHLPRLPQQQAGQGQQESQSTPQSVSRGVHWSKKDSQW